MRRFFWLVIALSALLLRGLALSKIAVLRRARATEMLRVALQKMQKTSAPCSKSSDCNAQVQRLLRAGADADGQISSGTVFLLFAARRHDTELMHQLEVGGATVTSAIRIEKLVLTANGGKPADVQKILDAGTPVNARAFDGRSALEVAVKSNQTNGRAMTLFLLKRGAEARQRTRGGQAMVPLALLNGGDLPLIDALQSAGAPTSRAAALAIATLRNDKARVRALLDAGTPVDELASPSEWTALQWAAYHGRAEICQLLLERGANPHLDPHTDFSKDALGLAREGHLFTANPDDQAYQRIFRALAATGKRPTKSGPLPTAGSTSERHAAQ